jgi:ABC-type phosphate transport system substrate-binding protein
MYLLSTQAEAAVRRGTSVLLAFAAALSVVAIPVVVALVSRNSATAWTVVGIVAGLISFLVATVTYWHSFRSRASAEKEAAKASKTHPGQIFILTEGPVEAQLLEELSATEREAQALLGEGTNTSVIRLRSRLLERGVWSERDVHDFDVALRTRNEIAHGEQEVSRTSTSQAIETIRRLRQKVEAGHSSERLTPAELLDGEPRPIRAARREHPTVGPAVIAVIVIVIILTAAFISRLSTSSSPPPVCAAGSLQLVGSSAFTPIAQGAATAYAHDCPGATITVTGGDSAYGLMEVLDAVTSGSSSAGSMIAMYDGPSPTDTAGLSSHSAGVLIFSVIAHTGLFPTKDITTSELRKIFVKPGEQGVVAITRADSGSRLTFITKVLGLNPGAPDLTPDQASCPPPTGSAVSLTSCTADSTAGLLNFVIGTPNAVGYANVSGPLTGYPQVSMISIDNAAPTPDNVLNGSYRFWTAVRLYAAMHPTALAKDFLAFLPHYIESNPPPDFIACSKVLTNMGADC